MLSVGLFAFILTVAVKDITAFTSTDSAISLDSLANKKVLVVGGSGRVGGSCVTQLVKRQSLVTVGGTDLTSFRESQERWKNLFPSLSSSLNKVSFASLDREDSGTVTQVLQGQGYDLVIHTAGPFQGKVNTPNGVIAACVDAGIPYIDVADDYCTASAAKTKYFATAEATGTPCIVSTGCWPGVSSLMAKQLLKKVKDEKPDISTSDLSVNFSFFTAGSGGAGVTLLVATFLILAEKALTIQNGRRSLVNPMEKYTEVNFGSIIGNRPVAHLNLLETASIADNLNVQNVQSLFGTAPTFWNSLLGIMGKFPKELLENEAIMRKLSIFSMPIVRIVDAFAGATNAMRCDVTCSSDPDFRATALYAHENLEPCVGECVVAFGAAILSGAVTGGVWFPEQAIRGGADIASVLNAAAVGAHTTTVSGNGIDISKEEVWGS